MAFSPISAVYVLHIPLDKNYKNQLYFENVYEQYNYFVGCKVHEFRDITYQRKDNIIRVDAEIDTLWNSNYVMYQNSNFTGKWFYAFITKMEYVSARATDIHIETDVYQTWLFNVSLQESFVVREHVSDDTIGLHLVDEQLETGEYKTQSYNDIGYLGEPFNVIAFSDTSPLSNPETIGNIYGSVVTGLSYYAFPNNQEGLTWLKDTIQLYATAGKVDAIVMIFTIPNFIVPSLNSSSVGVPITSLTIGGTLSPTVEKMLNDIDGYTPKNNKLHTYPYKFFYVANNVGQSATYRYENFPLPSMGFTIFGIIAPNPICMIVPNNYKGEGVKFEEGLTLTGFPMGSWTSDTYTAWFAQNGVGTGVAIAGSAIALVGGIATLNPLAIGGGALGVASQLAQLYKASIQPDQAKGQLGNGGFHYGLGTIGFYGSHMTIKNQFAQIIDNFFSMYGYKVNTLKVPETHSRENWNYIQTIDINIRGEVPADDMEKIKSIYNNGVTLWHNPDTFMDYSQSNNII